MKARSTINLRGCCLHPLRSVIAQYTISGRKGLALCERVEHSKVDGKTDSSACGGLRSANSGIVVDEKEERKEDYYATQDKNRISSKRLQTTGTSNRVASAPNAQASSRFQIPAGVLRPFRKICSILGLFLRFTSPSLEHYSPSPLFKLYGGFGVSVTSSAL